jgi:DNA processing protein
VETGTRAARPDAESRIAAVLRGCEGRAVTPGDDGYPGRLLLLRSPPSVVYLAGSWRLDVPAVAIVGARASNGDGEDFARSLAAELASSGIAVLSGLARGIDAAAHAGALDAGGRSGAVLGTGLDRAYPRANARLQARLRDSIGLLTEVPPGHAPRPSTFASRNRLLAALSDAVVLVQGRGDSGALITAREARDLGRPVGAVPWDPRDPLAEAPLGLLRAGRAELVRHAGDVLELMGCAALRSPDSAGAGPALPEDGARAVSLAPGGDEARLLAALRRRPEPLDVAAARAGLTLAAAGAAFVVLELHGLAETAPGGLARRARTG